MTLPAVIFVVLAGVLLLQLPRHWAPLPLLVGAGYMTLGQEIQVGPVHLTVLRILVAVGFLRVVFRGEHISGGWKALDRWMIGWAIWAVGCSLFHNNFTGVLVSRLGLAYDCFGLYFLMRIFIQDRDGVLAIGKMVIVMLIPIAVEMLGEQMTGQNSFAVFGGVSPESEVRAGKIRAQGPFGHSILAGTVGAVCWPMALLFWKQSRRLALLGLLTTGTIVLACRSSGPLMTSLFILLALALYRAKAQVRLIRWGALLGIMILAMVMEAPVYYLLARIDLTGSSTGWHRAELIDAALKHLGEWWFAGTDYTRHWMPTGVPWSKDHTDITNHYIKMGVLGGLPLMLLFMGSLVSAFVSVGKVLSMGEEAQGEGQFLGWTLGSIVFGHTITFVSVCYFDQSIIFFYLVLAAVASLSIPRSFHLPEQVPDANWVRSEA